MSYSLEQAGAEGLILTHHARARMESRRIPAYVLEWLLSHGDEKPDGRGGTRVFFTKESLEDIRREAGKEVQRMLERFSQVYVVLGDDKAIVTVGYLASRYGVRAFL
jgi:hypothetical protein